MTQFEPPAGPSRATPQGQAIGFAADLAGQHGWRRRVGRTIAYITLVAFALVVLAGIALIVMMSA
ncbi:MAG: hypothetical protein WKF72_06350 [Nocardioidaceae bacterium]